MNELQISNEAYEVMKKKAALLYDVARTDCGSFVQELVSDLYEMILDIERQ